MMQINSRCLLTLFVLFFSFSAAAQEASLKISKDGKNTRTQQNNSSFGSQTSAEGSGEYFLVPAIVRNDPERTAIRMNTCGAAILSLLDKNALGGLTDNETQPLKVNTVLQIAESRFRMAIKYQPNNYLYHTNLATALYRQGKIDEALEAINRALELNPKDEISRNYQEAILHVKVEVRVIDDEGIESK